MSVAMTAENSQKLRFHDVALPLSEDEDIVEDNCNASPNYEFEPYAFTAPQYIPKRGLTKYHGALKHLLLCRRKKKTQRTVEVDNAGFFSFITFSWLSGYVYKAYKKGLSIDDVPLCSPYDCGSLNAQRLRLLWERELDKNGPIKASFGKAAWKFMQTRLLISTVIFVISCILGFITPTIFMQKLIQFSEDPDADAAEGITWALAFTLSELFKMMSMALYYALSYRTATRLKAACLVLVYQKMISLQSLGSLSIGEVINLYGSDSGRLFYMVIFGPMVIGGPIVVVCCSVYIYFNLAPWALLGLSTFLLFYPLQYLLSRLTGYFKEKVIKRTDERLRLITEVLSTVKLIKMYAWEAPFIKRIHDIRKEELSLLLKGSYCQSVGISLAPTVPVISGILTFIIHVLSGNNLTAAQAYPLVTLLHSQLRSSLLNFRYGSENIIDGHITFRRIKELLLLEEARAEKSEPKDDSIALSVTEGYFTWSSPSRSTGSQNKRKMKVKNGKEGPEKEKLNREKDNVFRLESINLYVPKGSLVGICGIVGSGKSSLLKACMSQMKKVSGRLCSSGRSAYVSQEAWIEHTTFKNNVLFFEPFNAKRYIDTLYCCGLDEDIKFFPGGDETEIGERGVNLSGGQKQRLQLARAVYSNREIYFLDDPLSAVDSQVASHIFENCILGALNGKTVFLVSNQPKFLQRCNEILVMKDGKIVERGTHHELLSKEREYHCLVESNTLTTSRNPRKASENEKAEEDEEEAAFGGDRVSGEKKSGGNSKFTESEEQVRGEVGSLAYKTYVDAAGGFFVCFVVLLSILLNVGSNSFSSWWLAVWLKAGSGNTSVVDPSTNETIVSTYINDNPDLYFYINTYACIIGVICATSLLRGLLFTKVTLRASRIIHSDILDKLMRSYLRHFEVTPIGRIQNIFSRDLGEIDSRLPGSMETMIQNIWIVLFAFLFITIVFPWFIVALVILGIFYYVVGKIFRVAIRDLRRIEAITKAPIFSSISETVKGLPILHAFGKETEYFSQFCKKFDENSICSYMSSCAMRWMAIRLDSISVGIAFTTSMLVVILKGEVAPAMAGLALAYSAHISGVFQYTLRLMSEIEGRFIAVERMILTVKKFKSETDKKIVAGVPVEWPSEGRCNFRNVKLSYSKDLPSILNGITFDIAPGEKIGIVGRTGAGKSSLVAAIFRLVELSEGEVVIDGINTCSVPLSVLRNRLSVIPQDSVIFSGTLRFNLDPLSKYSDEKVWEVLRQTRLFSKVKAMENGLFSLIGEKGNNLSMGESQLLCLARALLRGSKILILDEATASVDPDTEEEVQGIIDENFSHCTVLTIAHRLKTIKNCDRVLVLHQGLVQEFDKPNKLLENPKSMFSKMSHVLN